MVEILDLEEIVDETLDASELQLLETPEIKTIVFDLGGVFFTDGSRFAIQRLQYLYGIEDYAQIAECFSNDEGTIGRAIRLGQATIDEFEEAVCDKLNIPEEKKEYIRNIWFGSYVPNYGMIDIVKKLSKKYRLVIFSGNVRERIEYLDDRYDFLKYFDEAIFSYNYELNKRDLEMYGVLEEHLDCNPCEAILIDDSKKNLIKAESIGMNGILYAYSEQFIEELSAFGIDIDL